MDLEVGWGMKWADMSQDRDMFFSVLNAVLNLQF